MSLKNFILRSSKSGGCQDDFSGLVSSFKLPHNVGWLTDLSGEVEPLVSVIFYLILNQLMNISVNDWDKNLFSDKSKSPNGCKKIKVGSPK